MNENLESEIRKALDAKAYEVEVPSELASRTMDSAAHVPLRVPLMGRWRAWRDARRMRGPVTGYPRWLLAPAAAVSAIALLFVGSMVTRAPGGTKVAGEASSTQTGASLSEASDVAGKGATSAGDASVDAFDLAEDVDATAGGATSERAMDLPALTLGDAPLDPQLVRAAEISVAVANFEDAWERANDIAGEHGGDVINSRTRLVADEAAEGTVRMRIPSTELEAVLDDLRDLGMLASLETTGDDIAEDIDLAKRKLKERKDREEELRQLKLRTTGAARADVDRRLVQVESDIEGLEKTQKTLEDRVALSIVNATITEDADAAGRGESMLAKAARTAGRTSLTILAGMLVIVAALAPLALIALLVWLVVRTFRRRRAA